MSLLGGHHHLFQGEWFPFNPADSQSAGFFVLGVLCVLGVLGGLLLIYFIFSDALTK